MFRNLKSIFLLFGVLLLSACVTTSVEKPSRYQQAEIPQHWSWRGRFAVRTSTDRISASLTWFQHQDDYEIRFFDLLGRQLIELVGDKRKVTMRTRDGEKLSASNAEHLLYDYLGWGIPINGLRYWVVGQIMPQQPVDAKSVNKDDLLIKLQQDGWLIEWQRYREEERAPLPQRMLLTRKDISLRLIMNDWWLGSE